MAQHFTASSCRGCIYPCLPRCVISRKVQGLNSSKIDTVCPPNLKTRVFTAEAVDKIDHYTSPTTALCLHGTRGIALIQYPNEACYISSRIRVGTSNHSNHSTSASATPARCDNHSTFALGYQHAKSMQSVNNFF